MRQARRGPAATTTAVGTPPRPTRRTAWWAAAATTALALVLGLHQLGEQSLSYDEAYSVGIVQGPFADTWMRITSFDTNQAPYYLLLSAWYELGQAEALLRLLSVLFYVAAVPLVFALGRRLVDARVGVVAAVVFTLNGLALEWAQEARSYSMVLFLTTLASYLLVRGVGSSTPARYGAAYGVVAVVGMYAHFLVGLVVGAQILSLLLLRPRPWRLAAGAAAVAGACAVPALVYVATLRGDPLNFLGRPSPRELVTILADLAGGSGLQLIVIGASLAAGAVAAWTWHRRAPGSTAAWGRAMPVLWVAVPLALLIAATYTVKPLLAQRYLIIIVPGLALVAAVGLVALVDRHRQVGVVAIAVVVAASALGVGIHYRQSDRFEWRAAMAEVVDGAVPGDALVVVPASAGPAAEYYQRRMVGPDLPVLIPQAGDPPPAERLWEVEQAVQGELVWNPMPDYARWRDGAYALVEERVLSPRVAVRVYERRG